MDEKTTHDWSDAAEVLAGYEILEVEHGPGAETTFYVRPRPAGQQLPLFNVPSGKPAPPPAVLNPASSPRETPLGKILCDLHRLGELDRGQTKSKTLAGGLRIQVNVGIDGVTRLMIARQGIYPSEIEWATVLAAWPYDLPADIGAERFEHRGWCCLRAGWPR